MLSISRPCIAPRGCAVVGEASDQTFLLLRSIGVVTRWAQRQAGFPHGVKANDFPDGWVPIGAKKHGWYATTERGNPKRFLLRHSLPGQPPRIIGIALDWKKDESLPYALFADGWILSQCEKAWSVRPRKGGLSGKKFQALCIALGQHLASILDFSQMRYVRQSLSMGDSSTLKLLSVEWDIARDYARINPHEFEEKPLSYFTNHLRWNANLSEVLRIWAHLAPTSS